MNSSTEQTNNTHLIMNEDEKNEKNNKGELSQRSICLHLFEQINDIVRDNQPPLFDNLCIEDIMDLLS